MEDNKLINLLRIETEEIIQNFKKASLQGKGTPQEVADYRENVFHEYMKRYFPFPHKIAKGIVSDSHGVYSDSVDCLVINPIHPYTIDNSQKYSIIMADGVDAAIELKPDISVRNELEVALKQTISVRKLRRVNGPLLTKNNKTPEEIEHSRQIPTFIFSLKAKVNIKDTLSEIRDYYRQNDIPKGDQFDNIVVLGRGIIINNKFLKSSQIRVQATGETRTGFLFLEYGVDTFAAFLMSINGVHHAAATFHGQIIQHYLQQIKYTNAIAIHD